MKLYKPEPIKYVRLQIVQQLSSTAYLTLIETNKEEVKKWLMEVLKDKCLVFPKGKSTTINIRDALGGKNLKSTSLRLYGLSPAEIKTIIEENLTRRTI
jgi:hypothetical protein